MKDGSEVASRVVIVTGASSGIGRATARAFAAAGDRVLAVGRRQGELLMPVDDITVERHRWRPRGRVTGHRGRG